MERQFADERDEDRDRDEPAVDAPLQLILTVVTTPGIVYFWGL